MTYDIAVVMATYNRPDLLNRCLTCLSKQTLSKKQFEVIVVADGPDEKTRSVVEAFKTNIPGISFKYLATESKQGPAAARNLGWRAALANYIAFTDDDCLPETTWLENYQKASGMFSGFISKKKFVFTGKVTVPVSQTPTDYEKNILQLETAHFVTANCCIPKVILEEVGGFDISFKTAWREDSDLHFNLLKNKIEIQKVDDAVVVHPVRKASWGVSLKEQKKSMFNALLYKKYPAYYRQLIHREPVWKYYIMIASFITAALAFIAGETLLSLIFLSHWLVWALYFTFLRLRGTSKSFSHVSEMFLTSLIIPFTSVYWTLYGSFKYKVLFL